MTERWSLVSSGLGCKIFKGDRALEDAKEFILKKRLNNYQEWFISEEKHGKVVVERDYSVL